MGLFFLQFSWISAPPVPRCSRHQHSIHSNTHSSPYTGFFATVQPTWGASDPVGHCRLHAGERPDIPLLPHAPVPSLLSAGALCCYPRTAPFLCGDDTVCMTLLNLGESRSRMCKWVWKCGAGWGGWDVGCGAGALQETWDLSKRRAGLTIKPTAEGVHHSPGLIRSSGTALGFERESVSSS